MCSVQCAVLIRVQYWNSFPQLPTFLDKSCKEELEEEILPMVYLALESNMAQVGSLAATPGLANKGQSRMTLMAILCWIQFVIYFQNEYIIAISYIPFTSRS